MCLKCGLKVVRTRGDWGQPCGKPPGQTASLSIPCERQFSPGGATEASGAPTPVRTMPRAVETGAAAVGAGSTEAVLRGAHDAILGPRGIHDHRRERVVGAVPSAAVI